jgi:uncharacterized protein (TIGR02611 family)
MKTTLNQAKRILKIIFGFTRLALGIIMIVTPGPGWLVIALALGVLAAEFVWARRLLDRVKQQTLKVREIVAGQHRAA